MERKFCGLVKDEVDLRDYIYKASTIKDTLSVNVDLRSQMSPVVDQGNLNSCTANAIGSGLREYLEIKNSETYVSLSRLFLYWHTRYLEGTVSSNAGVSLRDAFKAVTDIGICPEVDFPYDEATFTNTPSTQAEADAPKYQLKEYLRVSNLVMLKASLDEGLPVVVGMPLYKEFYSDDVKNTGLVPQPTTGEETIALHAVLAVGYDDVDNVVILRNSWGQSWGDKGYFYLPYAYWNLDLIPDMWTGNIHK